MPISNLLSCAFVVRILVICIFISSLSGCTSMHSLEGDLTVQRVLDEVNVGDLVHLVTVEAEKYQLNVTKITKLQICDVDLCVPIESIASLETQKVSLVKTVPTVLATGYVVIGLLFALALGSI